MPTTRRLSREARGFARYAAVGGACTALDVGLFALFAGWLDWPYLRVAAATFVLATLLNYALAVRFVFVSGARHRRARELAMVYLVSGVGLALNQAMLALAVEAGGWTPLAGKVGATAVVLFWNYLARRVLVFGALR